RVTQPDGSTAWRAGALMVQRLPEGDPALMARGAEFARGEAAEDDWRRAVTMLASARDDELTDADLDPDALLFRLYHEDGVRVYEPVPLRAGCRCSEQRARTVLSRLPRDELPGLAVDGKLSVNCEFCNATYVFRIEEFLDHQ
ncbi:MAG TPA: Hsp33 family molecular chaperone HslO, partial [Alphaproteobacteria bacterium]|nr:Hsp33 family molecular chaperone HslO [Alphaproteobacteria bacterium]